MKNFFILLLAVISFACTREKAPEEIITVPLTYKGKSYDAKFLKLPEMSTKEYESLCAKFGAVELNHKVVDQLQEEKKFPINLDVFWLEHGQEDLWLETFICNDKGGSIMWHEILHVDLKEYFNDQKRFCKKNGIKYECITILFIPVGDSVVE